MKRCPICGSDISFDGMVEGSQETNNHHRPTWSCSECGWDNYR